jgi:hypothetical protein
MSLRQWSGPFVEIWIGDYFLAEGQLDSFAGGCTSTQQLLKFLKPTQRGSLLGGNYFYGLNITLE